MLRAYAEMLPRLHAEECLSTLNLHTASGSMVVDKRGYDKLVKALERAAGEEPVRQPLTIDYLRSQGFSIVEEPRTEARRASS